MYNISPVDLFGPYKNNLDTKFQGFFLIPKSHSMLWNAA